MGGKGGRNLSLFFACININSLCHGLETKGGDFFPAGLKKDEATEVLGIL